MNSQGKIRRRTRGRGFNMSRPRMTISSDRSGCLIVFSLFFLCFGLGGTIILHLLGVWFPSTFYWIFAAPGGLFLLAGIWEIVVRQPRHRRWVQENGDHPCMTDYLWNRNEAQDESGLFIQQRVVFAAVFLAITGALGHIWYWFQTDGSQSGFRWGENIPPVIIASIFTLIGLAILVSGLRLAARRLRYGTGRLIFEEFPFLLGSKLRCRLVLPPRLRKVSAVELTLQCWQEQETADSSGETHTSTTVLYEQTQALPAEVSPRGNPLPILFDLPADESWCTRLNADQQTFWELLVEAKGTRYYQRFLVPVYGPEQLEDAADVAAADAALKEPGENIPYNKVRKELGL